MLPDVIRIMSLSVGKFMLFFISWKEVETGTPKSNSISFLKPFFINSSFNVLCGITK